MLYGNTNMKGEIALLNVTGIAANSRDFLPRRCRQEMNDDGKNYLGRRKCFFKLHCRCFCQNAPPTKTSASDTPEVL